MSVMKIHKNRDFTIVSKTHLHDKRISLKAKGLLTLMLSLPENWDYSVNGLAYICKERKAAIQSMLEEPEQSSYLTRRKERSNRGQFECVYDIFEVPQSAEADNSSFKNETDLTVECEPDEDEIPAENDSSSGTEIPLQENHDTNPVTDNDSWDTYYKQKTKTKKQKQRTEKSISLLSLI